MHCALSSTEMLIKILFTIGNNNRIFILPSLSSSLLCLLDYTYDSSVGSLVRNYGMMKIMFMRM